MPGLFFDSAATIVSSVISSNEALARGGAIYLSNAAAPVTLVDSAITRNSAAFGKAIYCDQTVHCIANNTRGTFIAANTPTGVAAISCNSADCQLYPCGSCNPANERCAMPDDPPLDYPNGCLSLDRTYHSVTCPFNILL